MDKIKVYLTNKKTDYLYGGKGLYCWEFEQSILEPDQYYYKTKKNLYRLFFNNEGFWIGRLYIVDNVYWSVEKEIGAVYCETLKGRFYWK